MKSTKYIAILLMIYSFNNSYAMTAGEKIAQASAELAKNTDPASQAAKLILDSLKDLDVKIDNIKDTLELLRTTVGHCPLAPV